MKRRDAEQEVHGIKCLMQRDNTMFSKVIIFKQPADDICVRGQNNFKKRKKEILGNLGP